MNTKLYWRFRLAWARWRVKAARSRVWGLRRKLRLCRGKVHAKQLELPFR